MWHLHWSAAPRRPHPAESTRAEDSAGTDTRTAVRRRTAPARGSFRYVRLDTPDAAKAADVPESVRVRGR